jgi:lipopolysaccharide transport system ATP-binding protein
LHAEKQSSSEDIWQALVPRAQRVVQPLANVLGYSLRERSYFTKFWALRDTPSRSNEARALP